MRTYFLSVYWSNYDTSNLWYLWSQSLNIGSLYLSSSVKRKMLSKDYEPVSIEPRRSSPFPSFWPSWKLSFGFGFAKQNNFSGGWNSGSGWRGEANCHPFSSRDRHSDHPGNILEDSNWKQKQNNNASISIAKCKIISLSQMHSSLWTI